MECSDRKMDQSVFKRYKTKLSAVFTRPVSPGILARSSATAFIQVFTMYPQFKATEKRLRETVY